MTPIQEFIEVLKIHRDTALQKEKQYEDLVLTEYYEGRAKAFKDAISFAESHLEKEKEVIINTWNDGAYGGGQFTTTHDTAEQYYNETFNTKKKWKQEK